MRLVEIRESVLGGLGLFALRDFAPGDVVLSETAFLTAKGLDWESDEASISPDSVSSRLITKTVQALSPEAAKLFWSFGQAPQFSAAPCAHGVFWTNYIDAAPDEDGVFASMFEHTCRLNHACPPHANVAWEFDRRRLATRTTRAVAAGQELLVDYVPAATASTLPRAEYLRTYYGFVCSCRGECAGPAPAPGSAPSG